MSLSESMSQRQVTAKYLADLMGLNPELVRKYARQLREMLACETTVVEE
ncbi:MAG TPA: hypothetical protein VGS11_11045 [Candidatus Bathyarchaeia archaeon]|nr:hypothetical protein [Candidatus Bathyarchaeia archaeon]